MRIQTTYIKLLLGLMSGIGILCNFHAYSQDSPVDSSFVYLRFDKQLKELIPDDSGSFEIGEIPATSEFNTVQIDEKLGNMDWPISSGQPELVLEFYHLLQEMHPLAKWTFVNRFFQGKTVLEEIFNAGDVSKDLIYLAPGISAMNPRAKGNGYRKGIWQLTHFQGVLNGLTVNQLVDQRCDLTSSTQAFLKQIKENRKLFGDTRLALIAYFLGNSAVANILESKVDSTRYSHRLFPEDWLESLAFYEAVALYLKEIEEAGIQVQLVKADTVDVKGLLHLQQVSSYLDIDIVDLKDLNPVYNYGILPGDSGVQRLILPGQLSEEFESWSDSIYHISDSSLFEVITPRIEYPPAPGRQFAAASVKDLEIEGKVKFKYKLKRGDVLGVIAEKFDVRVSDLKYWNNIYNERKIQAGKTLQVFVDEDKAEEYRYLAENNEKTFSETKLAEANKKQSPPKGRRIEHVVRAGESPYHIAKKYNGVSPEAILEWNNITDARKIQVGQKLIVYLAN